MSMGLQNRLINLHTLCCATPDGVYGLTDESQSLYVHTRTETLEANSEAYEIIMESG